MKIEDLLYLSRELCKRRRNGPIQRKKVRRANLKAKCSKRSRMAKAKDDIKIVWIVFHYNLQIFCLILFLNMESGGASPLLILRSNNKSFKSKQRTMDKRIRNKKFLREEIYSNHNIFHSNVNLYRNMTAQNIIWDKNYNFKCVIN